MRRAQTTQLTKGIQRLTVRSSNARQLTENVCPHDVSAIWVYANEYAVHEMLSFGSGSRSFAVENLSRSLVIGQLLSLRSLVVDVYMASITNVTCSTIPCGQ